MLRAVDRLLLPSLFQAKLIFSWSQDRILINVAKNEKVQGQRHLWTTVTQEEFLPTPKHRTLDLISSIVIASPTRQ